MANKPVDRAAGNDIDFKTRATRSSVRNGLFGLVGGRSVFPFPLRQRQIEPLKHQRRAINLDIHGVVPAETEGQLPCFRSGLALTDGCWGLSDAWVANDHEPQRMLEYSPIERRRLNHGDNRPPTESIGIP